MSERKLEWFVGELQREQVVARQCPGCKALRPCSMQNSAILGRYLPQSVYVCLVCNTNFIIVRTTISEAVECF